MAKHEIVTREQQREMGLLPERQRHPANFVAADPRSVDMPPAIHSVTLEVTPSAQQAVVMHTSAVDRSKGFQIAITPIALVLAILAVLVSVVFENQIFTFLSLLIFWCVFAVVYVIGWALTALVTPEFVSWYEARRKWNIVEREQSERWDHYKRQAGGK
jgi:uncharacterized protein YacL